MKQIKVLHLIEGLSKGGAERRLINDLTFADTTKIDHCVCTIFEHMELKPEIAKLGVPVYSLKAKRGLDPAAFLRLLKMVRRMSFGVIHTQLFWADLYGRLIKCFKRKLSLVCTVQSSVYEPGNPYLYAKKRRCIDLILGRYFTDKFIAVSQFVKKSLSRRLGIKPEKIEVIYNTVNPDNFSSVEVTGLRQSLGLKEKQIIFLAVGRLNSPKGYTFLIRALREIKDALPDFTLLIAGDGPDREQLHNLSVSLGLEEQVKFLGECSDIRELLSISDIFILPSLSEGFSVSLLEAMFMRRVCLTSDIEPNKELIEDGKNGFLFKSGDIGSLAKAILRVVGLKDRWDSFVRAGEDKVRGNFLAQKSALRLGEIYSEFYHKERC